MSHLSEGQELAMRQLLSIELASPIGVEILRVVEPDERGPVVVEISVDCAGVPHGLDGIVLRGRERLRISIPSGFPFAYPSVSTPHDRWAGTPHVQWRREPCLYRAPTVEWSPADGMYGFIERLFLWLERAAAGTLDAAGAPLHPPVQYRSSDAPLVIPRADAPVLDDDPWLGTASVEHPRPERFDLVGWVPRSNGDSLNRPAPDSAAVVLMPGPLDWEYPRSVGALVMDLHRRDVSLKSLLLHLGYVAAFREPGQPLLVVVGSAMRGTVGDGLQQHLSVWRIGSEDADRLSKSLLRYADEDPIRQAGEEAFDDVVKWLLDTDVEWCDVREARAEIVERRDSTSPLAGFRGKSVVIWGCGALGAPIADSVVRAGASIVKLYDNAKVHPGVLVRQPFVDDDLGAGKALVLAQRLDLVAADTAVSSSGRNVLHGPLSRPDWHDGADILIDATASVTVQMKLERMRRLHPQPTTVITALVGHTAERGLATVAGPGYTGAGSDALRATKLACVRTPHLKGFLDEFWPDPPRVGHFQPEPGCSAPTFRGSAAEAAALAGTLLTSVAVELDREAESDAAIAHLVALPAAEHTGARSARLVLSPAIVLPDARARFEIRLGAGAAAQIHAWTASARRRLGPDSETGGVLFGERDDATGVIWIDEATGPPSDSVETPELFVCGTSGVKELDAAKGRRTSGSVHILGMWHTHPRQSPDFSTRDLRGMLELLDASESPRAQGLILISGWAATAPELGAYVFEREELRANQATITTHERAPLPERACARRDVGLALSGGGSRAIAFHLGCLRVLNEQGALNRVRVVSGVSGGAVMAALWAYSDDNFDLFDARVRAFLRRGLARDVAQRTLLSRRAPEALVSGLIGATRLGDRRVSRTDAFIDVLSRRAFGDTRIDAPRRDDIDVVLNACDLRTGSAFRFGSAESGTWRLGTLVDNDVSLATAVAASAAYPVILPGLDRRWEFERRDGTSVQARVVLTDGGVFDNLGTTCLEPGRSAAFSTNVHPVDYIVACDAGQGLYGVKTPVLWPSRMKRSFESTFRKVQDAGRARLHQAIVTGELQGMLLPYLGQQDRELRDPPPDLVSREEVMSYPTNFSAMSANDLARLAKRGEQLTRLAIDAYAPEL